MTVSGSNSNSLEYITITGVDDLQNGERLFVEIDDQELVVLNIAGDYFAIGDVCSHDDGPLGEGDVEGFDVICPRHGARFDIRSGKVVSLPAIEDIPDYPVRVVNGQIQIGIPFQEE